MTQNGLPTISKETEQDKDLFKIPNILSLDEKSVFSEDVLQKMIVYRYFENCAKLKITDNQDLKMAEELMEFGKEVIKGVQISDTKTIEYITDKIEEELADALLTMYGFILRHHISEDKLIRIMSSKLERLLNMTPTETKEIAEDR
ncbi:MAG: hypothetical protein ACRC92_20530 [Peptostreptococcaceae bacterium]